MSRVDLLVSNPGHHVEIMLPVAERLARQGHECRVLSLCELRGFATPVERIAAAGVASIALVPGVRRSSAAGSQSSSPARRQLRRLARMLAWYSLLRPSLRTQWRRPVDAVAIPNDAAFPYDRITATCRRLRQPMVLLQEGIRFALPADSEPDRYGLGGAAAIAAWGEASAGFFRQRGVAAERVRTTGSPRFELEAENPGSAPQQAETEPGTKRSLLLATNPIDDQGFCSTVEKVHLIDRFLDAVEPLVREEQLTLMLRWHRRESSTDYERLLGKRDWGDRVVRANDEPLSRVLATASAVVILASTVGLEALAAGRRLGVLEIPGWGHVFDYVSEGAATPLTWSDPTGGLRRLLDRPVDPRTVARFVERHLGPRQGSAERVADLIEEVIAAA